MGNAIYWTHASIATATAVLLSLPTIGNTRELQGQDVAEYRPLDEASRRLVVEAVGPNSYVLGESSALFPLISELAFRLVKDSKPLDSDFSQIVDKEFWNLLR